MTIGYSRVPKTLGESFKYLLERHNIMVRANPEKQIALGDITFFRKDEEHVIEYFEEDDAYEIIVNKLVGEFGGELQLRRVGETLYLDWLDEIGELSLTPLAIGLNLLSKEIVQDSSELYTIIKPLGLRLKAMIWIELISALLTTAHGLLISKTCNENLELLIGRYYLMILVTLMN
ncbi:hypothetical protein [Aerococcus urinaeequi]|uniref:hypothetical protein n=1 Tax=Aerococcus urinaeequi TaxID=51665 RepID=UPI003D6B2DED